MLPVSFLLTLAFINSSALLHSARRCFASSYCRVLFPWGMLAAPLDMHWHPVMSRDAPQCYTKLLLKPVESREKASVLSFGLLRCKCHPVLMKLAAATAPSSSAVFQGCVSALVTTQRTLIGYSLLVQRRNKMNARDDPAVLQCHFVIMNHLPFFSVLLLFFLFTNPLVCIIL